MILRFYPCANGAYVPFGMAAKEYDLDNGSLSEEKDIITGYYSAEAFLNDLEYLLAGTNFDIVVVKKVKL